MEHKKPNLSYVELVEKLLNEAKKKKEKTKDKKKGHSKEKMADKDYDGDGEVETSKEEYFGSKDKAIKKNMAKKEIVSKKKKKQLDEGRLVGNEQMIYGGFPRIINVVLTEAEYKIPAKASESTGGPEEVGIAEFKKLMQSGAHPIMTGQSDQTARGVPPEIRAQALEYIKMLEAHPKGAVEGYGKDHPIFKEAMKAHEFFKKHFEQFGVENQIADDYNLFDLNEDRTAIERAAMNPSGAYTPRPSTMETRKRSDPITVQMQHGRDQARRTTTKGERRAELSLGSNPATGALLGIGTTIASAAAAAKSPAIALASGGADMAAMSAGALGSIPAMASLFVGQKIGSDYLKLDTAEGELELEKVRKTAPAQPEDYAKAAKEAAERRKKRGIQTYD